MIARREQLVNYAILAFFSLVALYPVLGILSTALGAPGESAGFHLPSGLHVARVYRVGDEIFLIKVAEHG